MIIIIVTFCLCQIYLDGLYFFRRNDFKQKCYLGYGYASLCRFFPYRTFSNLSTSRNDEVAAEAAAAEERLAQGAGQDGGQGPRDQVKRGTYTRWENRNW